METNKITTIIVGLAIVVVMGVIAIGSNNQKKVVPSEISSVNVPIFFYGNSCPHCADVEEWIKTNKVEEKIEIIKKEVYDNQENARELTKAAESCGLPTDSIGVPFLYAEGKCVVGTPEVTSYLSEKSGVEAAL